VCEPTKDSDRLQPQATLADVARESGVSQITVSRVIRKWGSISESTRDRVEEAIARVGYVPNRIAGALAGARSDLVGVIIPSLTNIVYPDVLRGLNDALCNRGLLPVVSVTGYSLQLEEQLVRSLLALRPAAIIVTGLQHSKATKVMLKRSNTIVIEIMDNKGAPIDVSIGMSHHRAAKASAEFLLQRGYRRFGYVGHEGPHRDLRSHRRMVSFVETVRAAGANVLREEIAAGGSSVPAGRAALERLLAKQPTVEAVYFSNDDMAIGGVQHCLANGLSTPGDLALFGFNGLDIGQTMAKPLSTVLTYRYEIGVLAGQAILARLDNHETDVRRDVGFKLIEGATA
jgi:LacI family transcriptional regulator, gluconate utilization system Gnt-I transcriptional repressor